MVQLSLRDSRNASSPRAATRKPRQAGVSHNFLPSSRPRWCDLQNTQKHNKQLILVFLSFVFRYDSLSLLLHFGSASLYTSVLFFFFPILLCFRWWQDKGGRRLLGFWRVWPAEMEKRSAVARDRWSCCGDVTGEGRFVVLVLLLYYRQWKGWGKTERGDGRWRGELVWFWRRREWVCGGWFTKMEGPMGGGSGEEEDGAVVKGNGAALL